MGGSGDDAAERSGVDLPAGAVREHEIAGFLTFGLLAEQLFAAWGEGDGSCGFPFGGVFDDLAFPVLVGFPGDDGDAAADVDAGFPGGEVDVLGLEGAGFTDPHPGEYERFGERPVVSLVGDVV